MVGVVIAIRPRKDYDPKFHSSTSGFIGEFLF
jgi:hypothetical protein